MCGRGISERLEAFASLFWHTTPPHRRQRGVARVRCELLQQGQHVVREVMHLAVDERALRPVEDREGVSLGIRVQRLDLRAARDEGLEERVAELANLEDEVAQDVLRRAVALAPEGPLPENAALKTAIVTPLKHVPEATKQRLAAILAPYLA